MIFTLDNHDGAGVRDYTAYLSAENPLHILRKLNQPEDLTATLLAESEDFVVPAAGARVIVARDDGHKLFTGYLTAAPAYEYLGFGMRGPCYRYSLTAKSDEVLLDRKAVPPLAPFVTRTAGSALKQLTSAILPNVFDVSGVLDCDVLPRYSPSIQQPWSEQAAEIAMQARAAYRAHDGQISLRPFGGGTLTLDETDAGLEWESLELTSLDRLRNDLTLLGQYEPKAIVKDYFLGDGLTLNFDLSQKPFLREQTVIVEEEYLALDPMLWAKNDPANVFSVANGKLQAQGGSGADGAAVLQSVEPVELGGAVVIQHGELVLTAASDGVIGGLYSGSVLRASCFAGFRIVPSGAQSAIRALVNGTETGNAITTAAGHRYALTTRIYAAEPYRSTQLFHSSAHPAGSGRGGDAVASSLRLVLEVHDIDPANPGTQAAASAILYDAIIAGAPGYCTYAPVNAASMQATLSFTRLLRAFEAEVRSTIPGQSPRTRLLGSLAEGAECSLGSNQQLHFFSPFVPVANEAIVCRYRRFGRAVARVQDAASIAAHVGANDDGVRAAILRVKQPVARTSSDCETAALAALDDMTQSAWQGNYDCWSDQLPAGADPLPGDSVQVNAPSRGAVIAAILRQVELTAAMPDDDRFRWKVRFANDAAEPLALAFEGGRILDPLPVVTPGSGYVANLPDAEITGLTSTTVNVDAGLAPAAGWGVEVRRSDFGWGDGNDRNLIGRFTTQTFTLARLARIQTYYLKLFDGSSPRKYSRFATALHIDYPF